MEKFTTNDTIKFLKTYKQLTCLWKHSDFNYRNRTKRLSALNELAKCMNVPNFGPKEAQLKIHSLRNTYLAEKRKAISKKENINGTEKTYMPKLRWFDIADTFLYNIIQSKNEDTNSDMLDRKNTAAIKTKENQSVILPLKGKSRNDHVVIKNVKLDDIATSMVVSPKTKHSSTVEVSTSSKLKQRKPTKNELSHFNISETVNGDLKSRQRTKEFESFGLSVVDQLNSLPLEMAFEAQASIQNLLTKKKIEALKMEQSVNNLHTVSESASSGEFIVLSPGSVDGIVEISQDGDGDIYYEYI